MHKNFFHHFIFFVGLLFSQIAYSKEEPSRISGNILYEFKADHIISDSSGVPKNNSYVFIEPNFSLLLDKNWSIKTDWRVMPIDVITTRNSSYPERYRTVGSRNRSVLNIDEMGGIIEELKIDFKNEDMNFFAGKFDPTFGTAYRKSKRIGVFLSDVAEDYNLREKIGAGITAILEDSTVTFSTFFNDTTGLSGSAFNNRKSEKDDDKIAGNTGNFSSYSASMEGKNFFGVKNLFYNLGYRSLGVDKNVGTKKETGYVIGTEYLYEVGYKTNIIPFFEITKIDNFTGQANRDAIYTTVALIGNFSNWTASLSNISRNIKAGYKSSKVNDNQMQISAGYKFSDNFAVDVSRANIKEEGRTFGAFGLVMRYIQRF